MSRELVFLPELTGDFIEGFNYYEFTELAFDEAAEARWQESRPAEADNMDVGPATETDLQIDLIEASGNPF